MVAFRPQRSWSASDQAKVRRAALTESSIRRTRVSPAGSFRGIAQNDQMRSRRGSHPWAVQRSVVRSRQKVRGLAGKVSKFFQHYGGSLEAVVVRLANATSNCT